MLSVCRLVYRKNSLIDSDFTPLGILISRSLQIVSIDSFGGVVKLYFTFQSTKVEKFELKFNFFNRKIFSRHLCWPRLRKSSTFNLQKSAKKRQVSHHFWQDAKCSKLRFLWRDDNRDLGILGIIGKIGCAGSWEQKGTKSQQQNRHPSTTNSQPLLQVGWLSD